MFTTKYTVTISDINYGGHLGNDKALVIFQQARIDFYKTFNLSELNIGDDIGTIQRESNIKYHSEGFLGDILTVSIIKVEFTRTSFIFYYEVKNQNDTLLIEGSTLLVAYDYSKKKISRIPKSFLEHLNDIF